MCFAEQFDPQPIHTDRAFAEAGPFGGLIASGWHSAGLLMRLFAGHYLSRVASLASPGVRELRWAAPLRPGDSVRLRTTITQTRPSRSKPERGTVHTTAELLNQNDQCPISLEAMKERCQLSGPPPPGAGRGTAGSRRAAQPDCRPARCGPSPRR